MTSCVTQSWCCLFFRTFDVANARVGAGRNPLKTWVIYHVNDLDAAPPEWRIGDVRSMVKTSGVTDGSITLGVAAGPRQFIADQLLDKAGVIRAMHERVPLCQPFSEKVWDSVVSTTSCGLHGHTILQEQRAAEVNDEIEKRSLEQLFPRLAEDGEPQATLSVGQSGIGLKRARDIAAPAHLGALIAAKPRIQAAMIQDVLEAPL